LRNIFLRVLLFLLVPVGCLPQTNTGKAETRGSCSPANTGNVGQITINCSGMSKAQAQKMVEILNKILANQLDPTQVMSKLDEILHAVDPNRPVTTYEFQGFRRITSPGRVIGDDAAVKNFQEFGTKEQAQDWAGLSTLAEQQKLERPEWFTPYFVAGMAYINLCQKEKAVDNLEYFVKRADGVPTFEKAVTQAEGWLGDIKAGRLPPPACKQP
jgi:hypothetical protein